MSTAETRLVATIEGVQRAIEGIELRTLMYSWDAPGAECTMLQAVGVRQHLYGYDEFNVTAVMQHFLLLLSGENHPCGLVGLLSDHGMLGRGYVDKFGELPRLLGDFARWVAAEWPPIPPTT